MLQSFHVEQQLEAFEHAGYSHSIVLGGFELIS